VLLGDSLLFALRFARPIVMAGIRRAVAQPHDCDRRGSPRHRRITGGATRSVAQVVDLDALDVTLKEPLAGTLPDREKLRGLEDQLLGLSRGRWNLAETGWSGNYAIM
jgi:hypothetical protein